MRREIASDDESVIGRLPSVDAIASPGGESIAYVVSAGAAEDEDFVAEPELHVKSLASDEDTTIGPGLSPIWDPAGERLAYIEPQDIRACEAEFCEASSSVVVADLVAETRRTLLRPERWSLLGWVGDELLVVDPDRPAVLLVAPDGEVDRLDFVPGEFWGASPDGRWMVTTTGRSYELSPLRGSPATPIDLPPGGVLGSGAWAPTGDRFVAVLLRGASSELVAVDTTGRVETIEGSKGAEGPVIWAPDGSSFVYARGAGLRLEAAHCEVDGPCRSLFSWARGVTLLALQQANL